VATSAQDLNNEETSGSGREDPITARRRRMYDREGVGFTPSCSPEAAALRQFDRLRATA
jgi:hypothetical protein